MQYVLLLCLVAAAEVFAVWCFTYAIGVSNDAVQAVFEAMGSTLLGTICVLVLAYEVAQWLFPPDVFGNPRRVHRHLVGG